ncbi:hypothetical protein F4808DRAFT_420997 [Astrocystis sublimbata]|nr:hypothetical protein F4808DRAFT_420997 [Astrocystis sublimbata]
MVLRGFSISETGAAESRSLPEWSTKHFEATGRPLRIAIDQSNWWYRNITAAKEADIKTKSPGSHPREKRIMERILYLLRMNIQLLFVFDGPEKPAKKWPSEYSYSESNIRLLKELLDQLGVPRHDAPGEAAAECVRLQEVGVIDATWTDNTDVFMFGGNPTLVQFHRKPEGDQFRNSEKVIVSSAAKIAEHANLTRKWFLMYATLVGCGYTEGLDGFSATRFFHFAQHGCFQGAANLLAAAVETPLLLSKWRLIVKSIIGTTFTEADGVALPTKEFPDLNILKGCASPTVSADEDLRNLPCLRDGWFRSYGPNMLSRYRFLLSNFNTRIHESWVARDLVPVELNHRLRESVEGEEDQAAIKKRFGIQPKRKRIGKETTPVSTVAVDPLKVIPELLSAFPSEMYRVVGGARVKIEAPVFRPEEMELLDCVLLRKGLISKPTKAEAPKLKPVPSRPSKDVIMNTTTTTTDSNSNGTPIKETQTQTQTPVQANSSSKRRPPIPKKSDNSRLFQSASAKSQSATPTPISTSISTPISASASINPVPLPMATGNPTPTTTPITTPTPNTNPLLPTVNPSLPQNRSAKRFPTPTPNPTPNNPSHARPLKTSLPILPRLNTHLPLPALHSLDISSSPTCITLHEDLTLPGELDWHNPPLSSSSPLPPNSSSTTSTVTNNSFNNSTFSNGGGNSPSSLGSVPLSRRADALAGKLSGPGTGSTMTKTQTISYDGRRKNSVALTPPLPIIRQPTWDHRAGVEVEVDLDLTDVDAH